MKELNHLMLTYTEEILGIAEHHTSKCADNIRIIKEELEEFVLGPLERPDAHLVVANSEFRQLSISGSFLVYEGVTLDNIVFEDISCFDMMQISNLARLSNVRFIGNKRGPGLLIRPFCDPNTSPIFSELFQYHLAHAKSKCMVDITDFYGKDLEIIGLPIENVRFDPTRHFHIDLRWNEIPWDNYGIKKSSFWRLSFCALDSFNASTAIYELPTKRSRNSKQISEELSLLKKNHPAIFREIPAL